MAKEIVPGYGALLADIKQRVRAARYAALRAANTEVVNLYWDIGRMIVSRQKGDTWGKAVVARLSVDLQIEFQRVRRLSASNLWRMRVLYAIYSKNEKLAPLVREIARAQNLLIFEKCKEDLEREFYLRATRKFGWTKAVLALNIEAGTYQKYLNNQTNFDSAVPEKVRNQAKLAVKDEYTFDLMELGEEHSEKELERAKDAQRDYWLKRRGWTILRFGEHEVLHNAAGCIDEIKTAIKIVGGALHQS